METYTNKLNEFEYKYWRFTILEIDNNYARIFVNSTTTAHRIHFSWIAYKSIAKDKELC